MGTYTSTLQLHSLEIPWVAGRVESSSVFIGNVKLLVVVHANNNNNNNNNNNRFKEYNKRFQHPMWQQGTFPANMLKMVLQLLNKLPAPPVKHRVASLTLRKCSLRCPFTLPELWSHSSVISQRMCLWTHKAYDTKCSSSPMSPAWCRVDVSPPDRIVSPTRSALDSPLLDHSHQRVTSSPYMATPL